MIVRSTLCLVALIPLCAALVGCAGGSPQCSSSEAIDTVLKVARQQIEAAVPVKLFVFTKNGLSLDVIRTAEQTPQRAVCNAQLKRAMERDESVKVSEMGYGYYRIFFEGERVDEITYIAEKTDDGRLYVKITKFPKLSM